MRAASVGRECGGGAWAVEASTCLLVHWQARSCQMVDVCEGIPLCIGPGACGRETCKATTGDGGVVFAEFLDSDGEGYGRLGDGEKRG